ncbi:unnamed protein product (macronuclear) [Paramecium tetraurelia]|uniref:Phospholipid scramblase n=1 Tax=Paramecium tetraurelia TaxID=5888 RepID=A0E6T9_PARTE|nr:uncharacterized protein GSPATT00023734001 [Paramecium tetraurelia]CAK91006.1 unnamed protein product [Paramecium tetraurelia]|eukprot:XP_001458403.1 hypothetical protein (macronuclear) [Paramecium tetraurelia strain d4-2]
MPGSIMNISFFFMTCNIYFLLQFRRSLSEKYIKMIEFGIQIKDPLFLFFIIMDKIVYIPEIRYKQINENTQDSQETIAQKLHDLEELISDIKIPNEVEFEHVFHLVKPNCCGFGPYSQKSEFSIQGLGDLSFSIEKFHCCTLLCFTCFRDNCYYCFCCCFFDAIFTILWWIFRPFAYCLYYLIRILLCMYQVHRLPEALYIMDNSYLRMEFWQRGVGFIKAKGEVIFNFTQTDRNYFDKYCAGLKSSFPQLVVTSPFDSNYRLLVRPSKNSCPQSIYGEMLFLGCCDLFNTSKKYHVEGLTQGKCEILNFRTGCQACARITGMQGQCCKLCPTIDYPRYAIQFESVRQVDKLAIIMALIHISMYNQWGDGEDSRLKLKFSNEICERRNYVKQVTVV